MFTTFLETISGYFNKRFLLSCFFPSVVFGGLCILVCISLQGSQIAIEAWNDQPSEWRAFLTIASCVSLLFVAYLLNVFSVSITRLYEGYWQDIPIIGLWGRLRRRFYQRRWDYLRDEMKSLEQQIKLLEQELPPDENDPQEPARKLQIGELYRELGYLEREWLLFYPQKRASVMPTCLGNILRSAELYPLYRYNLDAVVTWPRLQSLLPEAFVSRLQDAKATLDLLINLTTLTGVFVIGWELYIGLATRRWDWFLVVSAGWIVVHLTYQAALQAARSYGELIKSAYDLYRWELLSALHLQKPTSYAEECDLWGDVTQLLYRNYPPNKAAFRYETAKESKKPSERSKDPSILIQLLRYLKNTWGGKEK